MVVKDGAGTSSRLTHEEDCYEKFCANWRADEGAFVASLAFESEATSYAVQSRPGILVGSFVAGLAGYAVPRFAATRTR
jgi:hypothetical protein